MADERLEQAQRLAYRNRIVGTFYGKDSYDETTIIIDSPAHDGTVLSGYWYWRSGKQTSHHTFQC